MLSLKIRANIAEQQVASAHLMCDRFSWVRFHVLYFTFKSLRTAIPTELKPQGNFPTSHTTAHR